MYSLDQKSQDRIVNYAKNKLKIKEKFRFWQVDFSKPWWFNFFNRKFSFGFIFVSEILQSVFIALTPFIIGYAISQKNTSIFLAYGFGYILLEIVNRIAVNRFEIAKSETQGSIINSSYEFFLTVDPIYHSTKSSGAIQSKIQAAGREFTLMVGLLVYDLTGTVTSYLSVVVALSAFSAYLGVLSVGFFIIITAVSLFVNGFAAKIFSKAMIQNRDKWAAIANESLHQNGLIRSTFATIEQYQKLNDKSSKALESRTLSIWVHGLFTTITRLIYVLSIIIIGLLILNMINIGKVDSIIGVAMLLAYINGSKDILRFGRHVTAFIEGVENMNDLWKYINNFGKQTFPVLKTDKIK
jgi:hypothetical protein